MLSRTFDSVIVRPPPTTFGKCVSSNPLRSSVSISLALEQWREYVEVLKESGIEVIELEPLDEYPDSVFIQDAAVVSSGGRALLASFSAESRRGEELALGEFLRRRGFEVLEVEPGGMIEGGDVLVTSEGIAFVGISQRTNILGAISLERAFPELEVLRVPVSRTFHLLSGVSYLGNSTLAICPALVDPSFFKGFKLIEIPEDESYAANMLHIGDGKVLIPEGYPRTEELLRSKGFRPISLRMSEFWKCDGGITCLSLPIYRI